MVITGTLLFPDAGGVAWLNAYGARHLLPVLVFAPNLANNPKYVADAASHEIGHTFGLGHDGIGNDEYYGTTPPAPESLWGPIMGAAYTAPLTQWSQGDYAGASNTEDDLAMITDRTFAGTAVTVFDDGAQWLGGSWSAALTRTLVPGEIRFTAVQTAGASTTTDTVTVTVMPAAPLVTSPVEGETVVVPRPLLTGGSNPLALIEMRITCGDVFATTTSEQANVYGQWGLVPETDLPNGECSAAMTQTLNGLTSPVATVGFVVAVPGDDPGDESGDDTGDESGAVGGDESGTDNGGSDAGSGDGDLPDTGGSAATLPAAIGLMLLGAAGWLAAGWSRRGATS